MPNRREMASSSPSGGEPPSLDTTSSDPTTSADPNDRQPCHLLRLPVELLLDICDLVPFPDHDNFSRTCRHLAPELQKHLYRRAAARGYHSLLYAFRESRLDIIQRSLDYGFPPSVDDPIFEPRAIFYYFHVRSNLFGFPTKKCTLLGAAIKARSVPATKSLLSRGACLLESGSTCTPLVLAVRESCGVVQAILEHGADPNQVAVEGDKDSESTSRTPLTEALRGIHDVLQSSGRPVVLDAVWKPLFNHLLNSGADPSLPDGDGVTPLAIARRIAVGFQHSHNPGFAEALLERGADPNQPIGPGGPAAFLLVIMDDGFRQPADRIRLIEKMIEAGADVNAGYGDNKAPPLITAMIYCLLLETRRVAEEEPDDEAYKWFSATRDFHRLLDLYNVKKKKPGFAEIDEYEEIDLVDVLGGHSPAVGDPCVALLLKAGAKISRAHLDTLGSIMAKMMGKIKP